MGINNKTVVAVIKSDNPAEVKEAIELMGGLDLKKEEKVLLKPNLCFPLEVTGATNTQAETVETILKYVLEKQAEVIIAEGTAFPYPTSLSFRLSGIESIAHRYEVSMVDLNKDKKVSVAIKNPLLLKEVRVAKTVLECDKIISIAKLKTHFYTKITLSLKNMMGSLPGVYKHTMHHFFGKESKAKSLKKYVVDHFQLEEAKDYICRAVVDLCQVVRPDYAIIDGTTALEGAGPTFGRCIKPGIIIAGNDPVAADAIGAYLMGYEVQDLPLIKYAAQVNLGIMDLSQIEIKGEELSSLRQNFKDSKIEDKTFSWIQHITSIPFNRLCHHIFAPKS